MTPCRTLAGVASSCATLTAATTVYSRNADPDAHECLAEVCAASRGVAGPEICREAVRHHRVGEFRAKAWVGRPRKGKRGGEGA